MPGRQSESHQERIHIFLDLAKYYSEMTVVFPINNSVVIGGEQTNEMVQDQWHRIVRLTALRKFFLNERDNVYIPRVLNSCAGLLPQSEEQILEMGRQQFHKSLNASIFRVKFDENGADRTIPELADDFLNGMILHGDASKWRRHQEEKSAIQPVLNVRLVELETLLMTMKYSIEDWVKRGLLQL